MTDLKNIIIKEESKLKDIAQFITSNYPYLKLEFFSEAHANLEGNKMDQVIDQNTKVKDALGKSGEISISDAKTVTELEAEINKTLKLNAQVFRKSGKVWLETTTTDDWSLKEQNERGEEAFS